MPPLDTSRTFPSGERVPSLGQGTWRMGEDRRRHAAEVEALRVGIDLGLTLVDTAEMYADGGAETVVGEAIQGRREKVFLVSKVLPSNATRAGVKQACERSLARLGTDCLDLYLLHWRGRTPLAETFGAFADLQRAGKIRYFGVSNFDVTDLEEGWEVSSEMATDQILYNLARRGPEHHLLPWCERYRLPIMAYSPVEQGRLLPKLRPLAQDLGATPAQVALAWLLRQPNTIVIPKAGTVAHVRENAGAWDVDLAGDALAPGPPTPAGNAVRSAS